MDNNVISKFQMKSFKTLHFQLAAPSVESYSKIPIDHNFSGKFISEFVEKKWFGMILIHYSAIPKDENEPFSLDIAMNGLYEYDAENTPADREQFKKMLTMNGAVALLSILRGQVATASTTLGLSPGFIVPSVNLKHFEWEEQSSASGE